jgi:hypothetical protein
MVAVDANILRRVIGGAGLILAYGISTWRMIKSNPGDRFIECGSITVMILVVTLAVFRMRYFPDWVLESLEVLLFLMTFLSILFMFQQGYRALRGRKTH